MPFVANASQKKKRRVKQKRFTSNNWQKSNGFAWKPRKKRMRNTEKNKKRNFAKKKKRHEKNARLWSAALRINRYELSVK